MTMIPSNPIIALAVAALLAAPAVALAQSAQAPAQAPTVPAAAAPTAGKAVSDNTAAARVEARIKQLHAQLGITPAEQAQWEQFAQTMRDNARAMDRSSCSAPNNSRR